MQLAYIDIFFLIVVIFTVINAAIKGFVHEFFSKAAFFLGIFLAAVFYPKLDTLKDSFFYSSFHCCISHCAARTSYCKESV